MKDQVFVVCFGNEEQISFWRGEESASRLAKMLSDLFDNADSYTPYGEMASGLRVKVFNVVESTSESEYVFCPNHAVLIDPDVGECHICEEQKLTKCKA